MAIPYKHHDMKKIAARIDEDLRNMDEEAEIAKDIAAQAEFDEEWRQWLAYYDDEGHLMPGVPITVYHPIVNTYEFLSKSVEEQAAFIISEKKRMGML